MHIVAVQLDMAWEQPAENYKRVRDLLASQPIPSGGLIVLPEMFATGFSMNPQATAQSEARESEQFLRELAQQYDSAVMGGVVGPLVAGQASNEAVAFDPHGQELVRYRKMQPFSVSGEEQHYGRGDRHQTFTWQGVEIAPFLCYDLRFPEVFRPAVQDGAEVIVLMACWPAVRSEHWVRLLQARAIENLAIVVGVNRCGQEPNLPFDGRSSAFDQMGKCLFEADGKQQLVMADLDIASMRGWREKFPALRDIRSPRQIAPTLS